MPDKLHTLVALYDGSYFARLMQVGGDFDTMFERAAPVRGVFGCLVLAAVLAAIPLCLDRRAPRRRLLGFLLTALAIQTLGALLLPQGVRIHHALLVYPFPHLLVAAVTLALLDVVARGAHPRRTALAAAAVVVLLAAVIAGQVRALAATEGILRASGGRGWWSNALDRFAAEIDGRQDLVVLSLDWGFQEPLLFLTRGPRLGEMFSRDLAPVPAAALRGCSDPDRIYLSHSPRYTLMPFASRFVKACRDSTGARLWVRPYRDREGEVAFYAIRFLPASATAGR